MNMKKTYHHNLFHMKKSVSEIAKLLKVYVGVFLTKIEQPLNQMQLKIIIRKVDSNHGQMQLS